MMFDEFIDNTPIFDNMNLTVIAIHDGCNAEGIVPVHSEVIKQGPKLLGLGEHVSPPAVTPCNDFECAAEATQRAQSSGVVVSNVQPKQHSRNKFSSFSFQLYSNKIFIV